MTVEKREIREEGESLSVTDETQEKNREYEKDEQGGQNLGDPPEWTRNEQQQHTWYQQPNEAPRYPQRHEHRSERTLVSDAVNQAPIKDGAAKQNLNARQSGDAYSEPPLRVRSWLRGHRVRQHRTIVVLRLKSRNPWNQAVSTLPV
jgi:hypothetical protein